MEAILDTNSLVYAAKQKIDIYSLLTEKGYNPVLLSCVAEELGLLSTNAERGVDKRAAKLALQIAIKNARKVEVEQKYADAAILEYAMKNSSIILTNDKALRRKAKSRGVSSLSISKNKLLR